MHRRRPLDGGHDAGAVNEDLGLEEKEITFEVAMRLEKLLCNYETVLTRQDDRFIGLTDRAMVANTAGADIFVSIHCNSFTNESAGGIETWHYTGSKYGKMLAEFAQGEFVEFFDMPDRGIKDNERFGVLRHTQMPAIITEVGFISNPKEAKKMETYRYRQGYAECVKKAIDQYCEEVSKNDG